METIYKSLLLDHFHNPRNKGELDDMDSIGRGSNPRCGDEIEVGIRVDGKRLDSVRFRGRGCSVCLASASIMCECTSGMPLEEARRQVVQLLDWFGDADNPAPSNTSLAALGALRQHPARRKCVLLAWSALRDMLTGDPADSERVGESDRGR